MSLRAGELLNRQDNPSRRRQDDEEARWVSAATAPDQLVAELWQQLLRDEAIPSMLAPQDTVSFLGIAPTPVRVLVPGEMEARAQELLASLVAGRGDTPEGDDPAR
jgi:hypothetical protein